VLKFRTADNLTESSAGNLTEEQNARDESFAPEVKSVFKLPFMTNPPIYSDISAPRYITLSVCACHPHDAHRFHQIDLIELEFPYPLIKIQMLFCLHFFR
jgi:hypothetical protein